MMDPQSASQATDAAAGVSNELILSIVRMVIAAILGAVGGAYTAGRNVQTTRHTLRGEMNDATVNAAVAFGRLEERVSATERLVEKNSTDAKNEIARVESSVDRQLRIINRKLDALMAGGGTGRRIADNIDDDPHQN